MDTLKDRGGEGGGEPVTCELLQLPGDGSQGCSLDKCS